MRDRKKTLVVCSGYFNPIHLAHIDMLEEASKLGTLIVIINNDIQVELKGSVPFFTSYERCFLVDKIGCVHNTIEAIDKDKTIIRTLKYLYNRYMISDGMYNHYTNMIFCNGGNVTYKTAAGPEVELCKKLGIEVVYGVGGKKTQSSSELIRKAAQWQNMRE